MGFVEENTRHIEVLLLFLRLRYGADLGRSLLVIFAIAGHFSFFSALRDLQSKETVFDNFSLDNLIFENHFLKFLVFEVFCTENKFPESWGDLFVTFDHVELMSFPIVSGKYLISVFSALYVFPKLSFGRRVPPWIFGDSCWGKSGFLVSSVFLEVI